MREKMLMKYEMEKAIRLERCEKAIEWLKETKSELLLKDEIRETERRKNEMSGMLYLMQDMGAITEGECKEEKVVLEELFSPVRLYGADISTVTGELVLYVSEIKKED